MLYGSSALGSSSYGSTAAIFITAASDITLPSLTVLSKGYKGIPPDCVVLNTKNFAVSEYLNYGFNSFARFNNKDIVSHQNGIFEIDSSNLDEEDYPIAITIKSGIIDTYKNTIQRLRDSYILYSSDGSIRLTAEADKRNTRRYLIPRNPDIVNIMKKRRVKFERGIKNRYFNFKIENINGSNLEVDKFTITLEPLINKRR